MTSRLRKALRLKKATTSRSRGALQPPKEKHMNFLTGAWKELEEWYLNLPLVFRVAIPIAVVWFTFVLIVG